MRGDERATLGGFRATGVWGVPRGQSVPPG